MGDNWSLLRNKNSKKNIVMSYMWTAPECKTRCMTLLCIWEGSAFWWFCFVCLGFLDANEDYRRSVVVVATSFGIKMAGPITCSFSF